MPVIVSLASSRVEVVPGGTASVEVTLRNTGAVVDEFRLEVLGVAAEWSSVAPAVVPLFPNATAQAVITFAPARTSDTPAGEIDVAVRASSREDPDGGGAEEMIVVVAPFDEAGAELLPRTLRGARGAKAQIAVDNHGNRATNRTASATDPDQLLRFSLKPDRFTIAPGRAAFIDLKVKPKKTFLRGAEKALPFRANLVDGESTLAVDGTFVQRPILSRGLARLLSLLLLALIGLFALWQFGFKPAIKSAAQTAAKEQVKQELAPVATAVPSVPVAPTTTAKGGGSNPVTPKPTTKPATPATPTPATPTPATPGGGAAGDAAKGDDGRGGTSVTERVETDASKVGEFVPSPDSKQRFTLTDVVLQNPKGGRGVLTISRDDKVLFVSALENFRDLDFHVIAPIVINPGQKLTATVVCDPTDNACSAAVLFSGFLAPAPPDAATTTSVTPTTVA